MSVSKNGPGNVLTRLKQIQAGQLDPATLDKDQRRAVVVVLMEDGYSTAQIATILQVSERTIERDRRAWREDIALAADPKLVGQMVGRLYSEAELSVQRIRRTTRDKDTPAGVRVDGEHRCYQICSDLVQRMQSLGHLPTAAQRLQSEHVLHVDGPPALGQLDEEATRLTDIMRAHGVAQDDPRYVEVNVLKQEIACAKIAGRLGTLKEEADDHEGE